MTPKFTVILPVCHGGQFFDRALASLSCLTSPPGGFEAIITGGKEMLNDLSGKTNTEGWQFLECCGNRSQLLNAACAVA